MRFTTDRHREECFCNEQFDVKACSVQGIYKTSNVLKHDLESLKSSNRIKAISMIFCVSSLQSANCHSGRDCQANGNSAKGPDCSKVRGQE